MSDEILNDDEIEKLGMQLLKGQGSEFSESDFKKTLDWAVQVRIDTALLSLVLRGLIVLKINEKGEIIFRIADDVNLPEVTKSAIPSTGDLVSDVELFLKQRRSDEGNKWT